MGLGFTVLCGSDALEWFQISTFEIPTLAMMEKAFDDLVEELGVYKQNTSTNE
jgi:hypothetical protein